MRQYRELNEIRTLVKEQVSRESLFLVCELIEAASRELTAEMVNANETEQLLRKQGEVRGCAYVKGLLARVHNDNRG